MVSAVREANRQMPYPWPGAFFLTDPERTPDPVGVVRTLPPGTGVIYRHFGAADRGVTANRLRDACSAKGIPLLIANYPTLAMKVGADGVHWPEANAHDARKWQGRFIFQTQSAHSPKGLRDAVCDGVLYSTVFPSNSPSAKQAIGAVRFRKAVLPGAKLVYGLGGVNYRTAGQISRYAGFAAIEGFLPLRLGR